jgi:cupin fold WbuC family metalloprotein
MINSVLFYNFNYKKIIFYKKKLAALSFSKTNTKRICFHNSINSNLQYMLIQLKKNSIFKFHKHVDSDEVVFMVSGKMKIKYFSNKQKKFAVLSKSNPFFSCKKNLIHSTESLTKNCIYIEVKSGPFLKNKTIVYDSIK